jgi:hypothetical protein
MPLKEVSLFGVYIPPLFAGLAAAAVVWWPLRWALERTGTHRHIWHPALFNTALYAMLFFSFMLFLR